MRKYINGVLLTCDRCGKKRFIRGNIGAYGWMSGFGRDLCPDCAKEFNELLDETLKNGDGTVYHEVITDVIAKFPWNGGKK